MPEPERDPLAGAGEDDGRSPGRRRWALALLAIPLLAVVWPPLYNRADPALGGLPFFIWYQMAAVALGGIVTGIVYRLQHSARAEEPER